MCTCGHKETDHNTFGHCVHCDCDAFAPLGGTVDQTGEVEIIIDDDGDKPPEAA